MADPSKYLMPGPLIVFRIIRTLHTCSLFDCSAVVPSAALPLQLPLLRLEVCRARIFGKGARFQALCSRVFLQAFGCRACRLRLRLRLPPLEVCLGGMSGANVYGLGERDATHSL